MKAESIIGILVIGWFAGLTLKYAVFGLEKWDSAFHPERLEADLNGPWSRFAKPFLGVLS